MQLCELTGDFEKVRTITYNTKMDKAVYHNRLMRPVIGCVYAGEAEKDEWGNVYYTIYVRYPGVDVAMYVDRTNHWRTDEELAGRFAHEGYDTKERFIEAARRRIAAGDHFRFTEVEFLKHVAPELEEGAWESRKVYAERRAKKDAERKAKAEAEDAALVEKWNSEAYDMVANAVGVLKNGGVLMNETVTFYEDRWNYKSYSIINYLMDAYEIELPIRTRGFIANNVTSVTVKDGYCTGYRYQRSGRSKGSQVLWDYMEKLMKIMRGEDAA